MRLKDLWSLPFALALFTISLPFNGIERDLFSCYRFEIKPTMITFLVLLISWFVHVKRNPRRRTRAEKSFYWLAFAYASSQFLSIRNAAYPVDALRQAVIISMLLLVTVVVSECMIDKRTGEKILLVSGSTGLAIAAFSVFLYYQIGNVFLRMGEKNSCGAFFLQGDSFYFGDLLIFSAAGVMFLLLKRDSGKLWSIARWPLSFIWFSTITLTYTKGLLISIVLVFGLCLFLLAKKWKLILLVALIFAAAFVINISYTRILVKSKHGPVPYKLCASDETKYRTVKQYNDSYEILRNRINFFSGLGLNSVSIREKAFLVSLKGAMVHPFLGNGAGLSAMLLPKLADEFDLSASADMRRWLMASRIYGGDVNKEVIDSHNFFATELFNVGFVGLIPLVGMIALVLNRLWRAFRASRSVLPVMYGSTLIALLVYRFTGSLIVIPTLWYMLGAGFGISSVFLELLNQGELNGNA